MADQAKPASAGHAAADEPEDGRRRDFLMLATATMAAAGTALAIWPFVDQMEPAKDVLAAGGPLDVDLSKIAEGQQLLVMWRGRPIFVLRRTQKMLATLSDPKLLARLRDPRSVRLQQPNYATNPDRAVKPEYAVLVGICTHLGCIPELHPRPGDIGADWPGGYFCPCHGSKYDFAGRVFRGVPAPLNLPVPPYRFVDDTTLRIGENPEGSSFKLSDVEQM
jgi:ubiquinol-cytochrome c reductase iron-sulfur subunit